MEEDMVQLRLGQQQLAAELTALRVDRDNDRKRMDANHKENRDSIYDIRNDMQDLSDNVASVTRELHDYLLVQGDRDKQRDKAWWRAPFGTAMIVLIGGIILEVLRKKLGL